MSNNPLKVASEHERSRGYVPLPAQHNAFVYVYEGNAEIGEPKQPVPEGHVGVLSHGSSLAVAAGPGGARLILVAGKPIGEPVAKYGPFVMNTEAELRQAVLDFQAGRF